MKRLASIIGISLLATACTQQVKHKSECIVWKTVHPSRADVLSEGTTKQLIRNNMARDSWCNEANYNVKTKGTKAD